MEKIAREFTGEYYTLGKELREIVTLASQKKQDNARGFFKRIGEIKLVFSILLLPLLSPAQIDKVPTHFGIFGAQSEYSAKYQKPGGGFFGGYTFNYNYVGINTHILFGGQRNVPQAIAFEYGHSFGNFQPYISYQYYSCGKEAVDDYEGTKGLNWGGGISYYPRTIGFKFSLGLNGVDSFNQLNNFINYSIFSIGYYRDL